MSESSREIGEQAFDILRSRSTVVDRLRRHFRPARNSASASCTCIAANVSAEIEFVGTPQKVILDRNGRWPTGVILSALIRPRFRGGRLVYVRPRQQPVRELPVAVCRGLAGRESPMGSSGQCWPNGTCPCPRGRSRTDRVSRFPYGEQLCASPGEISSKRVRLPSFSTSSKRVSLSTTMGLASISMATSLSLRQIM